jgi:hypothetical protein
MTVGGLGKWLRSDTKAGFPITPPGKDYFDQRELRRHRSLPQVMIESGMTFSARRMTSPRGRSG